MGLIMEIFNDKIEIKRISFVNKKFVGNLWIINLPIHKKDFIYTNSIRLKNRVQPYFEINNDEDKKVEFLYDQFHMIKFKQAYHPVCIYDRNAGRSRFLREFRQSGRQAQRVGINCYPAKHHSDVCLLLHLL
jgi:hypothetical protein